MKLQYFLPVIQHSELFAHIGTEDIGKLLDAMDIYKKKYKKGNFIFYAGDTIEQIGIVLSGTVHILQEDYWGNRNILSQVRPGSLFGEAFACLPDVKSTVDVAALDDTEVMFINVNSIIHGTAQYAAYAENTVHVTTVDAAEAHVLFVGRSVAAGIFVVYAAL